MTTAVELTTFCPWYERLARRVRAPIIGRFAWSVLLPLPVAVAVLVVDSGVFLENAWRLCLLTLVSGVLLQYATRVLGDVTKRMFEEAGDAAASARILEVRDRVLSDLRFVLAGIFFGVANTLMGFWFGVPSGWETLFVGFFVVGFVCGMAVYGVYGVLRVFRTFTKRASPRLDVFSPDGCGGLRPFGDAILVFGCVTLIAGVGISLYILMTDWDSSSAWVGAVQVTWVAFPYVAAFVVVADPVGRLAVLSKAAKRDADAELRGEVERLEQAIKDEELGSERRSAMLSELESVQKRRVQADSMSVLPFGNRSKAVSGAVLAVNSAATIAGVVENLPGT